MELTPSEKLTTFFASSRAAFYKKGDIVLRAGAAHSGAFYLKKGFIKDSSFSPDGREFTLFIFKPSDIFSYSWIFNEVPNEHSFRAMSECIIYEKSREGLLIFLSENPDVHLMVSQSITIRLRGLLQRIETMAFGTASQRVCSTLYLLAERFGKTTDKGIIIPMILTQREIAELVGVSRETTSIEIKRLMDSKLLERSSGNYIVTDAKKLWKKFAFHG